MKELRTNINKLNDTIKESGNNLTDFDAQLKQENNNTATKYKETKKGLEDLKKEQEKLNTQLEKSRNIYKNIYENGK